MVDLSIMKEKAASVGEKIRAVSWNVDIFK
jgi:hypothetical protein